MHETSEKGERSIEFCVKCAQIICRIKINSYLCKRKQKGTLTEWLGSGLQNRVQQFESARYLYKAEHF